MQLIQVKNNTQYIHGIAPTVSELIEFYYNYRKQYGYMVVMDDDGHVLATLGSDI